MTREEAEHVALRALEKARRWGAPVTLQPHIVEALLTPPVTPQPVNYTTTNIVKVPDIGPFREVYVGEAQDDPGLTGD